MATRRCEQNVAAFGLGRPHHLFRCLSLSRKLSATRQLTTDSGSATDPVYSGPFRRPLPIPRKFKSFFQGPRAPVGLGRQRGVVTVPTEKAPLLKRPVPGSVSTSGEKRKLGGSGKGLKEGRGGVKASSRLVPRARVWVEPVARRGVSV